MPVLVYNVPGRTIVDVSNETLRRLATLPNIIGIKDATGDVARVSLQRLMCGEDWVLLSGDDPTALGYIAHGGPRLHLGDRQCGAGALRGVLQRLPRR